MKYLDKIFKEKCLIQENMLLIPNIEKPDYVKQNLELIKQYFEEDDLELLMKLLDFQKTTVKNEAPKFVVEKIAGDGNCFFRALSQQMVKNENNYKQYRKEICDYIENNSHLFIIQMEALLEDMFYDTHIFFI